MLIVVPFDQVVCQEFAHVQRLIFAQACSWNDMMSVRQQTYNNRCRSKLQVDGITNRAYRLPGKRRLNAFAISGQDSSSLAFEDRFDGSNQCFDAQFDALICRPVIQIGVDAVAVIHDEGIQAREPGKLHQRRTGKVEDTREKRHAEQFRQNKDTAADEQVSAGDGVQADELGGDKNQAGQKEGDQSPAWQQCGNALFDGVNQAHRSQSGHESGCPVPDGFFDQEYDGGEPGQRDQQKAF